MKPILLRGHHRPLTCVKVNKHGDLLFTCGKDAVLAVWRTDNGQQIGQYDCGRGAIWFCDVTIDSKYLIVASGASKIFIFLTETGEMLAEILEEGPCKFVEWNKDPKCQNMFVMANDDFGENVKMGIKVYKVEIEHDEVTQHQIQWSQRGYRSRCNQCRWGPLDREIVTCHDDGSINIWDAATGSLIRKIEAYNQPATCIAFDLKNILMLSCSSDGTAKLFETATWTPIRTYKTDRPLNACDISPLFDVETLAKPHILLGGGQSAEEVTTTATSEGKFQALLYNIIHEDQVGSIKGHFGPINTLTFLADGHGYVSGGEEGMVRIYHFDREYLMDKYE
ncbi:bifunctional WD40-repeat-containing domain superfamily/WD40 repeat/Eukaryotic translation initiation factor 3 subunit I/WD40 repeat [Babesia duncani]|uniref:Eukaryotic translation initiation factor 3 subunit I n=1 Tax=Babesia duncani TaxID=323732 RepID=A0AAD9PMT6_9APIC|nr:bifunctional WD40-repeat-containing domain superfamily/WD40 repeat/Eukaryotic translation initiation factor 3 subunit I/WD40 repeat [Babesia duncani]